MPSYVQIKSKLYLLYNISLFLFFLLARLNVSFAGTTPPTTSYSMNPESPNGKNNWYTVPITVTLTATDLESGVKEIYYRIDSSPWQRVSFVDTLNLVPNPSLEIPDPASPINTKYWTETSPGDSAKYERDYSNYSPGYQTVSIKTYSNATGWHTISHPNYFAVAEPYSNMNASVWMKTLDASPSFFRIFAVSYDTLGNRINTQIAESPSISGTNDWTQLSKNFVLNVDSALGVYMEIGINGSGTIWTDAANINNSNTNTSTVVSAGVDGEHTMQFYSVDRANNIEAAHTISFKIDQTPPGNWHDSGAIRGLFGSDHELYVYTNVEDQTSGLSTLTDKYQYLTDRNPDFGYFSDLLRCDSTWNSGEWVPLFSPPFLPGSKTAFLMTFKTDFCDNDWKICKTVKFYAEDLAGNTSLKDFCINGPWIKVNGGIVGAKAGINMISEASEDNTDGLIELGNNLISFFSTSTDWRAANQPMETPYNYDTLWNTAKNKTPLGSTLPVSSGVFYIDGNYTVSKSQIPNQYNSAVFNAIVFVNGELTIEENIEINQNSTLLFIVKEDVKIEKSVSEAHYAVITDGDIYTAYNIQEGNATPTLNLRGFYVSDQIILQRTLQGTGNEKYPSEEFFYEPKYITKTAGFLGIESVKWLSENE